MSSMYNEGSRKLQDEFDSRRIADRLEQRTVHDTFTEEDRALIEGSPMFFLATVDAEGRPDCSYKGGMPGFVRVQAEKIFPNCPRYIHKMQIVNYSKYAPRLDYTPPEPEWKQMEEYRDVLPRLDEPRP